MSVSVNNTIRTVTVNNTVRTVTVTYPQTGSGGGVTSVAVSGSDGIEVDSGSPITSSGTIALGLNKANTLSFLNVEDGADASPSNGLQYEIQYSDGSGGFSSSSSLITNASQELFIGGGLWLSGTLGGVTTADSWIDIISTSKIGFQADNGFQFNLGGSRYLDLSFRGAAAALRLSVTGTTVGIIQAGDHAGLQYRARRDNTPSGTAHEFSNDVPLSSGEKFISGILDTNTSNEEVFNCNETGEWWFKKAVTIDGGLFAYSKNMTTTERDALTGLVGGEIIFNTTTNKHQGYDGSVWNDFY